MLYVHSVSINKCDMVWWSVTNNNPRKTQLIRHYMKLFDLTNYERETYVIYACLDLDDKKTNDYLFQSNIGSISIFLSNQILCNHN